MVSCLVCPTSLGGGRFCRLLQTETASDNAVARAMFHIVIRSTLKFELVAQFGNHGHIRKRRLGSATPAGTIVRKPGERIRFGVFVLFVS